MGNIFSDIGEGLGLVNSPPPPATAKADVVKDPNTNLYVNKRTGVVSVDPEGLQTLINPTLAQQAARNIAISNQLLNKLGGSDATYGQAVQGQQGLVGDLDSVISGQGPSVAMAGLAQGMGDIARQQQSQASGLSGQNAASARQQAMQNTAMAQAKANQDAALIRAGEIARAREAKANVLSQISSGSTQRYGVDVAGGLNASQQAGAATGTERTLASKEQQSKNQLGGSVLNGLGSAITNYAASGSKSNDSKDDEESGKGGYGNDLSDGGDGGGAGY